MSKRSRFDELVLRLFKEVPYIGEQLARDYETHTTLREFIKYGSWISLQFFALRAPMVWLMVEKVGVHYIMADYVAGLILAVAGFFVSKFWIFKFTRGEDEN